MDLESLELPRPIGRPSYGSAPAADADYEYRAEWSDRYVTWFIGETQSRGRMPEDVRPLHRYEVEFNACVIDPEAYVRDTREELGLQRSLH